ncbi:pentatricopeptide repeat-containing protein At2g18520, mitochondrial-like [Curcuma longa]|uniref:pentatricopeptide repeat-containing protein At2g18520, mitochondrial-like n=1 Tax=Curcuma longa TaxID=136217 RepID=UPI003D9F38FC
MAFLSASRRHFSLFCHLRRGLSTAENASGPAGISAAAAKYRLQKEFDPDRALSILSAVDAKASPVATSRYALELTVRRLARTRRFSDVEALIESRKSEATSLTEPYVVSLIISYGSAGMLDHAIRTFDQVPTLTSAPHSVLSFNALLTACSRAKKPFRVPSLFAKLSEEHSITPDCFSYGILIKSLCVSGKVTKALETLREMVEVKQLEPTLIIYTTLIDSLYKAGKQEEAEELWKKMVEKGCVPDQAAYNVRVMHRALNGKPEEVLELIKEMEAAGLGPDRITYTYLITCHLNAGQHEDAMQVYKGLRKKGPKPNAKMFKILLTHLCEIEDFDTGFAVFKDSLRFNKVPDFQTVKLLVSGLVKEDKVQAAKEVIDKVKKHFPENLVQRWKKVEEELGLNEEAADAA